MTVHQNTLLLPVVDLIPFLKDPCSTAAMLEAEKALIALTKG